MTVEFTQDVEIARVQKENRPSWGLFTSSSLVKTVHKARELGWKEKKVQVRLERFGTNVLEYIVEPFEKDCGCPNMLRYSDYFD